MENRSWSDLPRELLEMILSHLPPSDHPYFASVCKSWNKVTLPVYPADESPLLVYFKKWGDGILHYYSPSLNRTFKVDCPLDLSNSRFYFSKDGWLVLYREFEVILANPVTNILHKFPGLPDPNNFTGITFSGCPPSNCMIFAIDSIYSYYIEISIWDQKLGWDLNIQYDNEIPFIAAPHSSPVVYDGCFYCLGMEGNLGFYDPEKDIWTILLKPKRFPYKPEESYLVESEGELFAVLIGNHDPPVQVFRLNQVKMVWERVKTLKSRTLFAGYGASLLTTTTVERMKNNIFCSRLLGVPKTIQAEMRHCEGRTFFVQKPCAYHKPRQGVKRETEDQSIYSYSLQTGKISRYCGSIEYPCSIWYEPRIKENL